MDKKYNNYIFDSWEALTQSELFLGHVAYPTNKIRNWYTWLYLAEIKTNKRIKIGITNALARRSRELEKREPPAVIKFAWSMPCPAIVERSVKQMLGAFIVKKKTATNDEEVGSGYTEILQGLPMIPLLLSIRLIILYVYLGSDFIPPENNSNKLAIIKRYMGDASSTGGGCLNANIIQYCDVYYERTNNNIEWRATYNVLSKSAKYKKLPKKTTLKDMNNLIKSVELEDVRLQMKKDIRDMIMALETDVVRNRHVCVLEDVYAQLNLAIEGPPQHNISPHLMTDAQKENQSFFKLYVTSLTDSGMSLTHTISQSQEDLTHDIIIDESVLNDTKPQTSRINKVKSISAVIKDGNNYGSQLYVAHTVDYDKKTFVRFFPIVVTSVTRIETNSISAPRTIRYKFAEQDWRPYGRVVKGSFTPTAELERVDFRDRPKSYPATPGPAAWGVYKDGDPTPQSGGMMAPFGLDYSETTEKRQTEKKQKKQKKTKNKKKSSDKTSDTSD